MNCTYCGTRNSDAEHRCGRCGRRLHLDTVPSFATTPANVAATARKLDDVQAIPIDVARAAIAQAPRQRTLFAQPVLPFLPQTGIEQPPKRTRRKPGVPRVSRKRLRLEEAGQQRLPLDSPMPSMTAEMGSGVRSAKSCSDPVAGPLHRLTAAALDLGIVAVACGIFVGLTTWIAGLEVVTILPVTIWGAIAVGIIALYKSLWWLGDGESPGMAQCRLQLKSFTGQRPTRTQRAQRFAGTILSVAAAGLGLIWTLGDEEQLGWNDYLSKTFPTPRPMDD